MLPLQVKIPHGEIHGADTGGGRKDRSSSRQHQSCGRGHGTDCARTLWHRVRDVDFLNRSPSTWPGFYFSKKHLLTPRPAGSMPHTETLCRPCKSAQLPQNCSSLPSPNLPQRCSHWESQERPNEPCKAQNPLVIADDVPTCVRLPQLPQRGQSSGTSLQLPAAATPAGLCTAKPTRSPKMRLF